MNKVFNTPFENSLRILLLLSVDMQNVKNADMITALDFIATYGGSLNVTNCDLHGENPFGFCEYTARREIIAIALKNLVMRGLVGIERQEKGFCYKINENGKIVVQNLDTDFSKNYLIAANSALSFARNKTEQQIIAYINEKAMLKLGGSNV